MTNSNTKNTKSPRQKKVLVASILLAGVIVAGGTFAWFTSTDEVTNKLSASNTYGVSITETFTPPTSWVPGQKIGKEVSVVNTGNIDAFVRVKLTDYITVTALNSTGTATTAYSELTDKSNLVELSDKEVTSLQAGSLLVTDKDGKKLDETKVIEEDYKPTETGLYIFERRNSTAEDTSTKEYVGYYYDNDSGTYYALQKITAPTSDSTEFTATIQTTTTSNRTNLTLDYSKITSDKCITATYAGQDTSEGSTADDIKINIYLDENYADNWTYSNEDDYFYYKTSVAAGKSTSKLVTAVELDDSVKNEAYVNFDYELTVNLDTVQVTYENGVATNSNLSDGWKVKPSVTSTTDETTTEETTTTTGSSQPT